MTLRFLILFIFCAALFFLGLGDRDLVSSHEARAAQNAQMILDEGHWLVPRLFDRHLELQKPPLYYWVVAGIAWLRGGSVDGWAVRLPAALSAFATVLFLFLLGIKRQRPLAGFVAALVLASSLHFTALARVGRIDMPLTMAITFALGGFHLAIADGATPGQRFRWHLWSYTWLAVGLLLKGPIAVVLPAVVVTAVLLGSGGAHALGVVAKRGLASLCWGVPWMLVLAGPWYFWANWQTNNQLFEVFFWYHNVERGLGGTEALAAHPWWFYGPRLVVDLLPWSLAIPITAAYWWRRGAGGPPAQPPEPRDPDAKLALCWCAAILLFLSCMSFKRADYLLPAYPGIAIFLGACAERWWQQHRVAAARTAAIGVLATYAIGWLAYLLWYVPSHEGDWPYHRIAQEIRTQTKGPVIFFRAESHPLAFHVRLTDTILEWENLQKWADRPITVYFVMPESCACEWRKHLTADSLVEVLRTADYLRRDRPLVVMRNRGQRIAAR